MLQDNSNNMSCIFMPNSQAIKDVIGPREDIPAPDMNTDGRVMSWFFDEYTKFEGFSPAVVTGKVCLHLYLSANPSLILLRNMQIDPSAQSCRHIHVTCFLSAAGKHASFICNPHLLYHATIPTHSNYWSICFKRATVRDNLGISCSASIVQTAFSNDLFFLTTTAMHTHGSCTCMKGVRGVCA